MTYISTRGNPDAVSFSEAVTLGLAPDGGLFVPASFPRFEVTDFDGRDSLPAIAQTLIRPFFAGDALAGELDAICEDAFSFPVPLNVVDENATNPVRVLELFHGPTAAFKDVGARFLAACLQRSAGASVDDPLLILVATSGDTGGAVAAAFHNRPGIDVGVLFPKGLVSPRQEQQLTCWGGNVKAFRVSGVFDDCQRMVKAAFANEAFTQRRRLSSANSINVGRLLPQMAYYAASSLWCLRETGKAPSYIVPTGNLGNALACVWARHVGLPIDRIVLATNANRTIPDFLASGEWSPRDSVATLASAMDVGNPSNAERLRHLFPDSGELATKLRAGWVDDDHIRQRIASDFGRGADAWCPHTATAMELYARMSDEDRASAPWIAVATAHPAKFETVVEPLIGQTLPVPAALAELLDRPAHAVDIAPDLDVLLSHL
ncbi:MAG: threonine synthase [Pseudomonadota bacterium]